MSIFSRNPNETEYIHGKKHWADVIKNSGEGNLLIWRQPEEDFNTNSTLIVMPGESAIFIKGGTIEAVFDNGTYKLNTENYPFISRLRNAFTGGVSTFNCVVYFVRMADSKEILWGTDSPIQVRDKVHNIRTDARVRGAYRLRITNPAIFLTKMIGNNVQQMGQTEMDDYFRNELSGKVKAAVSKFLNAYENELIGLDAYLEDLSGQMRPYMDEALSEYGVSCIRFSFSGLDIDTTKYDELDQQTIAKKGKITNAEADLGVMQTLGENWGIQQAANIMGAAAQNPGGSGAGMGIGAGLGMGMAAGPMFGAMAGQMFAPMNSQMQQYGQQPYAGQVPPQQYAQQPYADPQQSAGQYVQQSQHAMQQAAPQAPQQEDPMQALGKLKQLLDAGYVTQEDYDAKKAEILSRL